MLNVSSLRYIKKAHEAKTVSLGGSTPPRPSNA